MKKILLIAALVCSAIFAQAQLSTSDYANSATGTTLNTLTKIVVNATVPQAQIMATTDTSGVVGVTTKGTGTTGQATITYSGIVPCVFDNTTVANDYVQISATVAGNCHDVGLTRPTSGQIVGVVAQTGGAAGTYNVLLDKSIFPSASGTAPICSAIGSSDTITTATSFATVCPIPATAISGVGQILQITVHGVLTTTTTASPVSIMRVDYGASTGVCQHSGTLALVVSQTNVPWDAVCYLQIVTTGAPGTAIPWGVDEASTSTGGTPVSKLYCNAATCSAATVSVTTNSTQNVAITQTATLVAGESFTLQSLVVRNY